MEERMKTYNRMFLEIAKIAERFYPRFPYHNFQHGLEVQCAARNHALLNLLSDNNRLYLETAALLHDVVFVQGANDNEEKSALFSEKYLPKIGYSQGQIQQISRLIIATKWPTDPNNLLEEIICDSDLDYLGRSDFFEKSSNLMLEWNVPKGREWYENQLRFLENNHYYTEWAKILRDSGKAANIQRLIKMLQGLKC